MFRILEVTVDLGGTRFVDNLHLHVVKENKLYGVSERSP